MRNFLIKSFWFIFPILGIAYPLDFFISHNLKKLNDNGFEFEIWNDIYDGKANCEIAIFGSSRAANNFNTKILETSLNKSVYDFGISGQFFELHYLRYLELIKHNQKPKMIILSLETFGLTERNIIHLPEQFLPYLLFNENYRKYTANYENRFSFIDYYVPLIRYAGKPRSLSRSFLNILPIPDSKLKYKYQGFAGLPNEWNDVNDKKFHKQIYYEVQFSERSVQLFEQFIKECQENGIPVVFVYSPEYIEIQKYETNRDQVIDYFRQTALNNGMFFLDYSKDELSYKKENFFDSNHLTGKAADIFTEKLAEDLKKLEVK